MASDHAGGDGPRDDSGGTPAPFDEGTDGETAGSPPHDRVADDIHVGRLPDLPEPPGLLPPEQEPARKATEVAPRADETESGDTRTSTTIPPVAGHDLGDPLTMPLGSGRRGRVTIDFTGPPLDLPDAPLASRDAPLALTDAGKSAGELTLPSSRLPSSVPPAEEIAHDGWVTDRVRRTTPPPMLGVSSPSPIRVPEFTPLEPIERLPGKPDSIPPATGDALTLVERKPPSQIDLDLMAEVRDRYALDDLTGALQAAELVLGVTPEHGEALEYAESCRRRLEQLYAGRVGSMKRNPTVAVHGSDVRWLGLDHRAGFLLSQAAAATTVEELLDVSGMPRLEALKTLVSLLDAGAIRLE